MGFFKENWFWRGTQSAIFYYVSCSPCIERKYKRKRRNEAERAQKHREEVIATQPGRIQQPGAFQTNKEWTEEILMGPGPPKGWKRDPIVEKVASACDKTSRGKVSHSIEGTHEQDGSSDQRNVADLAHGAHTTAQVSGQSDAGERPAGSGSDSPHARRTSRPSSTVSSVSSSDPSEERHPPRPSLERRLSTAMDNLRDTLRSTMRPEKWNWIRYERDDEILSGINQRMTEMWNRATSFGMVDKHGSEADLNEISSPRKQRKRGRTLDSDQFDYQKYTRNPEINELHPPVVSRLPPTSDDAAWMLLPPPSAAIMEGKARPRDEPALRWPLAHIGRTPEEWKTLARNQNTEASTSGNGQPDSIPELSDSFTEGSSSDEDVWRSDPRHPSVAETEPSQPVGLDLVYVKDTARATNRPNWPVSQQV